MIESLTGLDPDAMLSAFVSHGLRTLRRMSTSKLAALFNFTWYKGGSEDFKLDDTDL